MAQRNKRILQIGDVLGLDFELPEGLERLNGWLVYNFTKQGIPQALDVSGSYPLGRYWESTEFVLGPGGAVARCLHIDLARDWRSRNDVARVRAVQDVPALARQL